MKQLTILGLCMVLAFSLFTFAEQADAAAFDTKVLSGVNLRSAPSTNSTVYRLVKKGESVHVIEKVNNYWLKVQTKDGRIGYISANSMYTNYIGGSGKTATATGGVNFRSAPSTSGSKIGFISKGSKVTVLEQVNAYWLKINYNGKIGYASTKYFDYSSSGSGSGSSASSSRASAIVNTAKSYIGKFTYKYGAEPWNTNYRYSDCSAFVQLVYNKKHGFNLPRTSRNQAKAGKFVSKSNLKAGDLVFFDTNNDGIINHVGIYIGNGQFIHSSPTNKVGINNLNTGYWKTKYKTARRVL